MANLTRNGALAIASVTSSQFALFGVGILLSTRMDELRSLTGGTTLTSTAGSRSAQFPYGIDDKIAFVVSWCATAEAATTGSLTLQAKSGEGFQADLGNYNLYVEGGATGSGSTAGRLKRWIIGPFESARFAETATSTGGGATTGEQAITLRITTDYLARSTRARGAVNILPFKLPVVDYAT